MTLHKGGLGDAPVESQYAERMKTVARIVDTVFNGPRTEAPRQVGFVLLVFPLEGHEGRCNYMSNANRADIVVLLKEQLARFEGRMSEEGHG